MTLNVDPLQKASVRLLQALYFDKEFPVTKAMNAVLNGEYPSVPSILATLRHYKDDPLVVEFELNNADAIAAAKESIEAQKCKETQKSEVAESAPEQHDRRTNFGFRINDAYESLKSVSIGQIEEALSKSISEVCGKDLMLVIDGIQKTGQSLNLEAQLSIRVKPRHAFG